MQASVVLSNRACGSLCGLRKVRSFSLFSSAVEGTRLVLETGLNFYLPPFRRAHLVILFFRLKIIYHTKRKEEAACSFVNVFGHVTAGLRRVNHNFPVQNFSLIV